MVQTSSLCVTCRNVSWDYFVTKLHVFCLFVCFQCFTAFWYIFLQAFYPFLYLLFVLTLNRAEQIHLNEQCNEYEVMLAWANQFIFMNLIITWIYSIISMCPLWGQTLIPKLQPYFISMMRNLYRVAVDQWMQRVGLTLFGDMHKLLNMQLKGDICR